MKIFILSASLALGVAMLWLWHESRERRSGDTISAPTNATTGRAIDSGPRMAERPVPPPVIAPVVTAGSGVAQAANADVPGVSVDDQRAHLQHRFAEERVDARWASTSQQALHDDLGRLASADVQIQAVECRSSLCRVVLALTGQDAGNTFVASWLHQRVWQGPGFAANQEATPGDPRPSLVMFLGRPGAELSYLE